MNDIRVRNTRTCWSQATNNVYSRAQFIESDEIRNYIPWICLLLKDFQLDHLMIISQQRRFHPSKMWFLHRNVSWTFLCWLYPTTSFTSFSFVGISWKTSEKHFHLWTAPTEAFPWRRHNFKAVIYQSSVWQIDKSDQLEITLKSSSTATCENRRKEEWFRDDSPQRHLLWTAARFPFWRELSCIQCCTERRCGFIGERRNTLGFASIHNHFC